MKKIIYKRIIETAFSKHLQEQWETAADAATIDHANQYRILNGIKKNIKNKRNDRYSSFYKFYSVAATLLLIIGISSLIYMHTQELPTSTLFVVSSGIQNTQLVILPDGSTVVIGPKSKLTYPANFARNNRVVELEGQGFFEVSKDKSKPFIVKTNEMEITALGTSFEVFNYAKEKTIETILLTGKIKVACNKLNSANHYTLFPNDKLSYHKNTKEVKLEKVNANRYSAWRKNSTLIFENEKLSIILPRLEQWYGINIDYSTKIATQSRFSFTIKDESLEQILRNFSKSSRINYAKKGKGYKLFIKSK